MQKGLLVSYYDIGRLGGWQTDRLTDLVERKHDGKIPQGSIFLRHLLVQRRAKDEH